MGNAERWIKAANAIGLECVVDELWLEKDVVLKHWSTSPNHFMELVVSYEFYTDVSDAVVTAMAHEAAKRLARKMTNKGDTDA